MAEIGDKAIVTMPTGRQHHARIVAVHDDPERPYTLTYSVEGEPYLVTPPAVRVAVRVAGRRRCHFCGQRTRYGGDWPFVDGRDRFVCKECQERDRIDVAQETDPD